MKTSKKVTITIGIPAHNEEQNIPHLLRSILSQKQLSYVIESVNVICDGCTDNTAAIVKEFSKKNPQVRLIERAERKGKADALNHLYKINKSDYLFTIDADLLMVGDLCLEHMVKRIVSNKELLLVGARHIPIMPKTIMGKFAYYSYISFEDAFLKINNGNNFYAMMATGLISKKLVSSMEYPKGTISDQCYLYAKATRENRKAFQLVKESQVLFSPVTTFQDWRILGVRSVSGDKNDVVKYFGKDILKEFYMPRMLYLQSIIKWLLKEPFYMTGAIFMNIFVRKFPYMKKMPKNGIWTLAMSSKVALILTYNNI